MTEHIFRCDVTYHIRRPDIGIHDTTATYRHGPVVKPLVEVLEVVSELPASAPLSEVACPP